MKNLLFQFGGMLFLVSFCCRPLIAASADTNLPPRLTVSLNDGSRVVGTSAENHLKFHSSLLGDIKLQLKDIRSIECVSSNTARLTTANGDSLSVWFVNSDLALLTSFGKVELKTDNLRRLTVSPFGTAASGELINIDFGSGGARGYSQKTGPAALGTEDDFWNFYDRDASSTPNNWRRSGTLANLKSATKEPTGVSMSVSDAAGAWNDDSSDPMYKTYDYPLDGGENVVTFTGLSPGEYDLLAYAPEGNYSVAAGGMSCGNKTNHDSPVSSEPVWKEGIQYARWRHIKVNEGQALVLIVHRGASGNAILSGVQIIPSPAE
jgi:hypothetical protein